jgi:hypothetical protein
MKILLGDFSVKIGTEDLFKPKTRNESLHEISNDKEIRVVNFAHPQSYCQKYDVPTS